MTNKKKNVIEQTWELYFKELKKVYTDELDEQMLFQVYKNGALFALNVSEQFNNRVDKDIRKSDLGENHDG